MCTPFRVLSSPVFSNKSIFLRQSPKEKFARVTVPFYVLEYKIFRECTPLYYLEPSGELLINIVNHRKVYHKE